MIKFQIVFLFLLIVACSPSQDQATQKMAHQLDQLYNASKTNVNYPYHNAKKAATLAQQLSGLPKHIAIQIRYNYFQELVNAGQIETAIEELTNFLKDKTCDRRHLKYFKLLGLAYMQLAEDQNCVGHSGAFACVMPMTENTIHQNPTGSRAAIEVFEQLLSAFPNQNGVKWLLNIAYMTLGKYPQEVPNEWRIELPQNSLHTPKYPLPSFNNLAKTYGIDVVGHAGSSALEDFDNDGFLDILASSYHLNEQLLYFRNGDGKNFIDQTKNAGLTGINGGLNFITGDVNNDGWTDVYITRGAWLKSFGSFPNSLLINERGTTFVDRTAAFGLLEYHPSQTAVFADFNLDGWLDLFVGYESTGGIRLASKLYLNQAGKHFKEVTKTAGIEVTAFVKGVAAGDYNKDGLPDIYLSIFGGKNRLYKNNGGDATTISFSEVSDEMGVTEPINSFPCAFFDYNNDGWLDVFVSGYYSQEPEDIVNSIAKDFLGKPTDLSQPKLYKNINGQQFIDVTDSMELNQELYTMGFNYGDLNGDGFLDLFLGTGEFNLTSIMPNRVFLNLEGQSFVDVTFVEKFGQIQKGHGVSFGDFDNDGDEDIYHVVGGAMQGDVFHNMLYENTGNQTNWITLVLEGIQSNTKAIGATVSLFFKEQNTLESRLIHRNVSSGGSFGNNSLQLEIGLGNALKVDSLHIQWPHFSRLESRFYELPVNTKYVIRENQRILIRK